MVEAESTMTKAILISIALVVIAIILPIGLAYIGSADARYVVVDGTNDTLANWVDPAIITLLTVLLPILVVVAIILYFIPKTRNK